MSSSESVSSNSRTNLIINYLPQSMSDESFRVLFAKYGDIRSAKIIRNKSTGYSYGFGFVEYFNQEDAEMAIKNLNGMVINHKKIKVSYARPSSDDIKNANLYVTNLPFTFTESDVRSLFSECGDIIQCRLLGNHTGKAFVLFNLHDQAKKAIFNFDNKLVPGTNCRIKVKFATNEPNKKMFRIKAEKSPSSPSSYSNHNNNINLIGTYKPRTNGNNIPNYNSNRISGPIRNTSHHHNRYNPLSQSFHELDHDQHHQMFHHHPQYPDHNKRQYHPYSSPVDYPSVPPPPPPPPSAHHLGQNPNDYAFNGTYDIRNANNGAGENILFVYNIGPETNEINLSKLFSNYGQVVRVNIMRKTASGEGRGYGFVTMKFYQDALNAINHLNGYKFFDNRPLQVSFKKM